MREGGRKASLIACNVIGSRIIRHHSHRRAGGRGEFIVSIVHFLIYRGISPQSFFSINQNSEICGTVEPTYVYVVNVGAVLSMPIFLIP